MTAFAPLQPGDPAPWFKQRSETNPRYSFDAAAGRWIVLCFLGSAADPHAQAAIAAMRALPGFFNDTQGAFFAVSNDPQDEAEGRLQASYPGYRIFWDHDRSVARLYGAAPADGPGLLRHWLLLDPTLRVRAMLPFAPDQSDIATFTALLDSLPPPDGFAGTTLQAPILLLPQVFEPAFCDRLINIYNEQGGEESGFMREIDGRTVPVNDHSHKRRRDTTITDPALITQLQARFRRRVVPEIAKVHQFHVTRMERYIVACYHANDGGHFRAHRDNTTKGTAHRRFAVSVNLNDDFDGGEVSFPEYGPRSFKAPPGGAVVFSCSLLHAVSPVTRGARYAFLPFLYDDAAAKLRGENQKFLDLSPEQG